MRRLKLQSAMEYLMTYGWALIMIMIVVVALFELGVIGNSPISTNCIPQTGFACFSPTFNHGVLGSYPAGNVIMTIGQTTGTNWVTANFFYVPQGTSLVSGIPTVIPAGGAVYIGAGACPGLTVAGTGNALCLAGAPTTFASGAISKLSLGVTFPSESGTINSGQTAAGSIWAAYTTSLGGPYYVKVATLTLKAS